MPSGFQQDINQLAPNFYRVVIDMSNNSYTSTYMNSGTSGGAVNPYSWDSFASTDLPTSDDSALLLAQGNLRFQRIIEEVIKHADGQILDVEVTGATDGDSQPTEISFTVKYDRDEFILGSYQAVLMAENNNIQSYSGNGEEITDTNEAVQDMVFRGLVLENTRSGRVYKESTGEGYQLPVQITDVSNDGNWSDLWSTITVNGPLNGTTLINS